MGKYSSSNAVPPREGRFEISGLSLKGSHISRRRRRKRYIALYAPEQNGYDYRCRSHRRRSALGRSRINVKSVNILGLQPYVDDKLKVSITDGKVSMSGNLNLQSADKDTLKVSYSGNISSRNFATIDKVNAEDL